MWKARNIWWPPQSYSALVTRCKKCITQQNSELLKIIFTFSCEKEARSNTPVTQDTRQALNLSARYKTKCPRPAHTQFLFSVLWHHLQVCKWWTRFESRNLSQRGAVAAGTCFDLELFNSLDVDLNLVVCTWRLMRNDLPTKFINPTSSIFWQSIYILCGYRTALMSLPHVYYLMSQSWVRYTSDS